MITRTDLKRYRRMTDHHRRAPWAKAFQAELAAALNGLPPQLRRLVILRYIRRKSWVAVGMSMNYHESHCRRLDKQACAMLAAPLGAVQEP